MVQQKNLDGLQEYLRGFHHSMGEVLDIPAWTSGDGISSLGIWDTATTAGEEPDQQDHFNQHCWPAL